MVGLKTDFAYLLDTRIDIIFGNRISREGQLGKDVGGTWRDIASFLLFRCMAWMTVMADRNFEQLLHQSIQCSVMCVR